MCGPLGPGARIPKIEESGEELPLEPCFDFLEKLKSDLTGQAEGG